MNQKALAVRGQDKIADEHMRWPPLWLGLAWLWSSLPVTRDPDRRDDEKTNPPHGQASKMVANAARVPTGKMPIESDLFPAARGARGTGTSRRPFVRRAWDQAE